MSFAGVYTITTVSVFRSGLFADGAQGIKASSTSNIKWMPALRALRVLLANVVGALETTIMMAGIQSGHAVVTPVIGDAGAMIVVQTMGMMRLRPEMMWGADTMHGGSPSY